MTGAPTSSGCGRRRRITGARTRSTARCPPGIEAFEGREPNDIVLWVESHRAVVAGDTVADFGDGLEVSGRWLREGVTRESRIERLRPLLDKPVEHVLATHGGPFEPAALERALA